MPTLLDPATELCVRIAAALFFLWAGSAKARDLPRFRAALDDYRLLPAFAVAPAALAIPFAELGLAATLPWTALCPWPEIGGGALLLLFAGAMAVNLLRGRRDIACGCSFGARDSGLDWTLVGRNVLAAAIIASGGAAIAPRSFLETASGVIAGFALFALLAAADAIWALFARHPLSPAARKAS